MGQILSSQHSQRGCSDSPSISTALPVPSGELPSSPLQAPPGVSSASRRAGVGRAALLDTGPGWNNCPLGRHSTISSTRATTSEDLNRLASADLAEPNSVRFLPHTQHMHGKSASGALRHGFTIHAAVYERN